MFNARYLGHLPKEVVGALFEVNGDYYEVKDHEKGAFYDYVIDTYEGKILVKNITHKERVILVKL